ncbi:MAG: helix-turn-helix transcriptional regulator [Flavobacteriales bacterium]|nr:helix-turn-helix transcriptional regulator [Flavobacteriales bacterium]
MVRKKLKRHRLKALRTALGWKQEDFALMLKISRGQYAKLKNNKQGINAELAKRIKLIEESAQHLNARKLLPRSVNPIWPKELYDHLKLREGELAIQIIDLEKLIKGRRKNALIKHSRNELIAAQHHFLVQAKAPQYMLEALSLLVHDDKNDNEYHSLEKVYLYEATLAGKKAELSYLRKKSPTDP